MGDNASTRAALELERRGFEAHALRGGIEAWKRAGGATETVAAGESVPTNP
jgi:rhodanese-related sulfurtransferase